MKSQYILIAQVFEIVNQSNGFSWWKSLLVSQV